MTGLLYFFPPHFRLDIIIPPVNVCIAIHKKGNGTDETYVFETVEIYNVSRKSTTKSPGAKR